jgi:hypothetical protein
MALDNLTKDLWIKVQQKHNVPVNVIGVPIKPTD